MLHDLNTWEARPPQTHQAASLPADPPPRPQRQRGGRASAHPHPGCLPPLLCPLRPQGHGHQPSKSAARTKAQWTALIAPHARALGPARARSGQPATVAASVPARITHLVPHHAYQCCKPSDCRWGISSFRPHSPTEHCGRARFPGAPGHRCPPLPLPFHLTAAAARCSSRRAAIAARGPSRRASRPGHVGWEEG